MANIRFLDNSEIFEIHNPEEISCLYFPLASETGLKSSIAPDLGGDCKLDQEGFLLEPVSSEDLRTSRSTRNFWCVTERGCWSAAGVSAEQEAARFTPEQDKSSLTAGFMWQAVRREAKRYGLCAEITSFVPHHENVEIMYVRVTNADAVPQRLTGIAAIPIYGRSADNIRDHRNVTSMLHRIRTTDHGVLVKPTMSFDEKGHRENRRIYYVLGADGNGGYPAVYYPTVDSFAGEGGTFLHPRAVYEDAPGVPAGAEAAGREAMGGIRFPAVTLAAGQTASYIILLGMSEDEEELNRILDAYRTAQQVEQALDRVKAYWQQKVNVRYYTGNPDFDRFMRWVSFQPFLRRIYGCSFLPHHDYGRGGRGWRDLWQDCLSLLLMDPSGVKEMLQANFGGVRIDGTNATIIGDGLGNFIADRNGIARVWMDHALWPLMTLKLYIDQTGDMKILDVRIPYFKDPQAMRGTDTDPHWSGRKQQETDAGEVYLGSILEHLLIQHLTAFYEVGAHNIFRLRGADWNDALDMASEHGESVAFTCAYAGSFRQLARLLRREDGPVELLEEIQELLAGDADVYGDVSRKNDILARYAGRCRHSVSGRTIAVPSRELADRLDGMADWLMEHIRRQEWIDAGEDGGWFNSYYDDHQRPLEGVTGDGVRMMLTGQVFAIMSGTATDEQVRAITQSADRFLYRREAGGYRLNTDFHELKSDMGRMFGFAYGEKENGAVFSHMTVMYANALYRRGFVLEGYKALQTLADAALDFQTSRIYPGIPEYFNADGRGMYHYLTGAASWYMLTVITEAFGVHGEDGNLAVAPKLVREQFDQSGTAAVEFFFAGKAFRVTVVDLMGKEYGTYHIAKAYLSGLTPSTIRSLPVEGGRAVLSREVIGRLPESGNQIVVELM
ncbi:MAG: cellobiose phosphorylase [Oscillospiraceae bacterium]|nr:cellobiose phosphorylase [Oscillospiraceae bacterium]